ncbi:MAG: hypothetical protein HY898_27985, partial [Deltaproteobacteria bacterium]|nr:hypothetical protein [Deltaproteobacteria bacterium]
MASLDVRDAPASANLGVRDAPASAGICEDLRHPLSEGRVDGQPQIPQISRRSAAEGIHGWCSMASLDVRDAPASANLGVRDASASAGICEDLRPPLSEGSVDGQPQIPQISRRSAAEGIQWLVLDGFWLRPRCASLCEDLRDLRPTLSEARVDGKPL